MTMATVLLVGHDLQYTVSVTTGDGGPQVTELRIKSPENRPLTSDDMRAIPLRRLAVAAAGRTYNTAFPYLPHEKPEGTAAGRRRLDDELLREVADRARELAGRGKSVRDTLNKHYDVSPFTIDKWLAKCREAGHLQPGELTRKRQ